MRGHRFHVGKRVRDLAGQHFYSEVVSAALGVCRTRYLLATERLTGFGREIASVSSDNRFAIEVASIDRIRQDILWPLRYGWIERYISWKQSLPRGDINIFGMLRKWCDH